MHKLREEFTFEIALGISEPLMYVARRNLGEFGLQILKEQLRIRSITFEIRVGHVAGILPFDTWRENKTDGGEPTCRHAGFPTVRSKKQIPHRRSRTTRDRVRDDRRAEASSAPTQRSRKADPCLPAGRPRSHCFARDDNPSKSKPAQP